MAVLRKKQRQKQGKKQKQKTWPHVNFSEVVNSTARLKSFSNKVLIWHSEGPSSLPSHNGKQNPPNPSLSLHFPRKESEKMHEAHRPTCLLELQARGCHYHTQVCGGEMGEKKDWRGCVLWGGTELEMLCQWGPGRCEWPMLTPEAMLMYEDSVPIGDILIWCPSLLWGCCPCEGDVPAMVMSQQG